MIDFKNGALLKLKPVGIGSMIKDINKFLIEGEEVLEVFKTVRDQVVFTNKRVITANVQGITGKKVDYTSIPYKRIGMYSVETSGALDLDSELALNVSGVKGTILFEFRGRTKILEIARYISEAI